MQLKYTTHIIEKILLKERSIITKHHLRWRFKINASLHLSFEHS